MRAILALSASAVIASAALPPIPDAVTQGVFPKGFAFGTSTSRYVDKS